MIRQIQYLGLLTAALAASLPGQPLRWHLQSHRAAPELMNRATGAEDEPQDYIIQYREGADMNADRPERRALRKHGGLGMAAGRFRKADLEATLSDPDVAYVSPDRQLGATHFPPWMLNEAIGYRFAAMTVPERP